MFSLFRKGRPPAETLLPSALGSRSMNLEERMAFRRELAGQVVREGLRMLGVAPAQYRFRLMPIDARHHRYVLMLDAASDFSPRLAGRPLRQDEVESSLRRQAHERYALVFEGIYWRIGVDATAFERRQVPHDPMADLGPRPWELVSDEEKEALMEAIRAGSELPVLHVGELEYQTDLAPLEEPAPRRRQRGG